MLTAIGGPGKDTTPTPESADLAVGIEKMQQAYTGFLSGLESGALPLEVAAQKEELEKTFLQMQTLANKLAEYQHQIGKVLAEKQPPATTWAGVVGSSGGSTGPTVAAAAVAAVSGGGEGTQAGTPAQGGQPVEQSTVQAPPAAVAAAPRTTSPDREAGAQVECTTTSSMQESKIQKEKRAEDCTHEELMQRRPANKVAKVEAGAGPMDTDVTA